MVGMEDNNLLSAELPDQEAASQSPSSPTSDELKQQRRAIIIAVISGLLIIAFLVVAVYFLIQNEERTTNIRDIFIILMALEFMVVGWAFVILVIQLAKLVNLLQNELKPILDSTNEAANTLRGTAQFISDNLAEPVVKLNSYMAAIRKFMDIFKIVR